MEEWITSYKIPFGLWMKTLVDAIKDHGRASLELVTSSLKALIENLVDLLQTMPIWFLAIAVVLLGAWAAKRIIPGVVVAIIIVIAVIAAKIANIPVDMSIPNAPNALILIALITVFTWLLHRSAGLTIFIALALLFILNQGLWKETCETLALVGSATLLCVVVGVPIGILAGHNPRFNALLRPVLDAMQTLPTFVYLVPTLVLFGLGVVPGMISTIIFAIPAPIRMTRLGIASVPKPLIEAGEAFGATRRQLLWKVELPSALPTIMAGINQCIMLCLSMVVIAALVGAGGLGKPVVRALNTVNIALGFEAGFAIVLVAIVIDRIAKARAAGDH